MKIRNPGFQQLLKCSAYTVLVLFLSKGLVAQTRTSACEKPAIIDAKRHFKELQTRSAVDGSSVDKAEIRRAATNYVRLAGECYESEFGVASSGPAIDPGGLWMGPSGATITAPVNENFVTFGTKWGAGVAIRGRRGRARTANSGRRGQL